LFSVPGTHTIQRNRAHIYYAFIPNPLSIGVMIKTDEELTEEEKEQYKETFEDEMSDHIGCEALNSWSFQKLQVTGVREVNKLIKTRIIRH